MTSKTASIEHVSDTAFWVAQYRALEDKREDALFRDPWAQKLVHARGEEIVVNGKERAGMAWSIAVRTRLIDDFILNSIAHGVDAVLNLGTGLDTRPYRLPLPSSFPWFEADFPDMIDFKTEVLKNEKPRCALERKALDVTSFLERRQLFEDVNARGKKILVLTEGVIIYLSEEEVSSLAEALHAQPHFHSWIVDYFSPFFFRMMENSAMMKALRKSAPFRFNPHHWEKFFKDRGWILDQMTYLPEEGLRLQRPPPSPWYFKWIAPFIPKDKMDAYREMTGYALLKRA
jgi:methyltransferase (TIGR00027 family)